MDDSDGEMEYYLRYEWYGDCGDMEYEPPVPYCMNLGLKGGHKAKKRKKNWTSPKLEHSEKQ